MDTTSLAELLRRAITGREVTDRDLDAVAADPRNLPDEERQAWAALSRWIDDDDIRARDPAYAERQRAALEQWLIALSTEPSGLSGFLPEEIARGDHLSSPMPRWGCLRVGALGILAAGIHRLLA